MTSNLPERFRQCTTARDQDGYKLIFVVDDAAHPSGRRTVTLVGRAAVAAQLELMERYGTMLQPGGPSQETEP